MMITEWNDLLALKEHVNEIKVSYAIVLFILDSLLWSKRMAASIFCWYTLCDHVEDLTHTHFT